MSHPPPLAKSLKATPSSEPGYSCFRVGKEDSICYIIVPLIFTSIFADNVSMELVCNTVKDKSRLHYRTAGTLLLDSDTDSVRCLYYIDPARIVPFQAC